MRVSEVLSGSVETFLEMAPEMQNHVDCGENPHKVTKSQVGLGNVTDEKQATEKDFLSHKSAPILDHPAASVTTEKLKDGAVTGEKIADGAVGDAKIKTDSITPRCFVPEFRDLVASKMNKEEGMGLSQNSFTDAEKTKLGAISLKDGEGLTVDTASLVLKSAPLRLRSAGSELIFKEELERAENEEFSEVYTVTEDPYYGSTRIAGRDASGIYKVYSINRLGRIDRFYGSANTECFCAHDAILYFAETDGEKILLRHLDVSTPVVTTLSVKRTPVTRVQDVFVLDDRIVVLYMGGTSDSTLFVESFTREGEHEWEFITHTARIKDHEDTEMYDRRFRRAVMERDNLYIAPVLDTTHPYAVLRVNRDGELTGKYMPLTSFTNAREVLMDLTVYDGHIYAFKPSGHIYKIQPETGMIYTSFCDGAVLGGIRGLSVSEGGDVSVLVQAYKTGTQYFYKIPQKAIGKPVRQYPEMILKKEMDRDYLFYCRTKLGHEFVRLEETAVISHIYTDADTYEIL